MSSASRSNGGSMADHVRRLVTKSGRARECGLVQTPDAEDNAYDMEFYEFAVELYEGRNGVRR